MVVRFKSTNGVIFLLLLTTSSQGFLFMNVNQISVYLNESEIFLRARTAIEGVTAALITEIFRNLFERNMTVAILFR